MLDTLKKILALLFVGENKKLFWLFVAIVFIGILDTLGVASIFPFLSVVSNPGVIETSGKLKWIYDSLGFRDVGIFLIALGVFSFLLLFFGNIFRSITNTALIRFGRMKSYNISKRLLSQYLHEPYSFFLDRNSSELTTYLMSQVPQVVSDAIVPFMDLLARGILAIAILIVLFIVNPLIAAWVVGVTGIGYVLIYIYIRKKLFKVGEAHANCAKKMYKSLFEAFGGIKDIKLLGNEHIFVEKYAIPAKAVVECYCWRAFMEMLPRYAFETIAFGAILLIALFTAVIQKQYQQVVPLVGLYALAAFRFMPALQQIYQNIANIRASLPSLSIVYQDFINCSGRNQESKEKAVRPCLFEKTVELRSITFKYPKAEETLINKLDLVIKSKTIVGLVGGSGAGKTTLIDILLGLLSPQEGYLVVDGKIIASDDSMRAWRSNIGYVPQHIYLCDDTVTRNIAFGVADDKIDHESVVRAAKLASIHDFVVNELPNGYDTEVGERGIRLSGGQRQRIGIARALYRDPSLLVFDEATSALDGITEDVILEAINNLAHQKTIILIAHRLSTVKGCDIIYMLEMGKIIAQGTYAQLIRDNEQFRQMAKVSLGKSETKQELQGFVEKELEDSEDNRQGGCS